VLRFILALACFAQIASGIQSHAGRCVPRELAGVTESRQKQARDLEQRVAHGPFYKELQRKFGNPKGCDVKLDGETMTLSYAFRKHGRLQARMNPGIEYSEQRADFRGLNKERAMNLLKAAEANSFGPQGCGINWNTPEEDASGSHPGIHALVFRGDSCNCQGRVLFDDGAVVGVALSNSC
jgi:hypothetical protein